MEITAFKVKTLQSYAMLLKVQICLISNIQKGLPEEEELQKCKEKDVEIFVLKLSFYLLNLCIIFKHFKWVKVFRPIKPIFSSEASAVAISHFCLIRQNIVFVLCRCGLSKK